MEGFFLVWMSFMSTLSSDGIPSITALVLMKLTRPYSYFSGIFCKWWQFSWPELVGRCVLVSIFLFQWAGNVGTQLSLVFMEKWLWCKWGLTVLRLLEPQEKGLVFNVLLQDFLQSILYLIIPGCELWITTFVPYMGFKTCFLQLDLDICSYLYNSKSLIMGCCLRVVIWCLISGSTQK